MQPQRERLAATVHNLRELPILVAARPLQLEIPWLLPAQQAILRADGGAEAPAHRLRAGRL